MINGYDRPLASQTQKTIWRTVAIRGSSERLCLRHTALSSLSSWLSLPTMTHCIISVRLQALRRRPIETHCNMSDGSLEHVSAVHKLPSELWLHISILAAYLDQQEKAALSLSLDRPSSSINRFVVLPPNLTPGSAPLTPLGPITEPSRLGSSTGGDYFGVWGNASGFVLAGEQTLLPSSSRRGSESLQLLASHPIPIGDGTPERQAHAPQGRTPSISLDVPEDSVDHPFVGGSALQNKINPIDPVDISTRSDPKKLRNDSIRMLAILSQVCRTIREAVWPLVIGRITLDAKKSKRWMELRTALNEDSKLIKRLRGYVRYFFHSNLLEPRQIY
jgi:hypothetical protein